MNINLILLIAVFVIFTVGLSIALIFENRRSKKANEIIKRYTLLIKDVYNCETLEKIDLALREEVTTTKYNRTTIKINYPIRVNQLLKEIRNRIETINNIK